MLYRGELSKGEARSIIFRGNPTIANEMKGKFDRRLLFTEMSRFFYHIVPHTFINTPVLVA